MKPIKFLQLFIAFSLMSAIAFGQQKNISEIEISKKKLEQLQKEIWAVDERQREQIKTLEQTKLVKDEFETTKQFEERKQKLNDKISEIANQILQKKGDEREKLHKQISEILSTEFIGERQIQLSQYDADNLRFTIFSKDGIAFNYLSIPINEAKLLKENFSESKILAICALVLDKDNKPAEYLLSVKIDFLGKTHLVSNQNLNKAKAMQMLFGNYDFTAKTSEWKTYKAEYDIDTDNEKIVLANVSTKVFFFEQFKENGKEKYFLVANDDSKGDCGACSGLPSFAVFTKVSDYWKIETAQKHGGEIGVYGTPGEPSLIKIGPEKYGIKFSWWYMQMGYESTQDDIWAFIDGTLREIVNISTSADNSGAVGSSNENFESSKSKVTIFQGSNPTFFDIKVLTTGRKAVKLGRKFVIKPFTKSETYKFSNGKYELVK
jgi:hypothetical protein